MAVEPKIGGKNYPPNHPFVHRVWNHYKQTIHFWGKIHPYFWFNTHIVPWRVLTLPENDPIEHPIRPTSQTSMSGRLRPKYRLDMPGRFVISSCK